MKPYLLASLATFGLAACDTYSVHDVDINSWVGRPMDSLKLSSWGAPSRSAVMADGTQVARYDFHDHLGGGAPSGSAGRATRFGMRDCAVRFDAAPNGVITLATIEGSHNCRLTRPPKS